MSILKKTSVVLCVLLSPLPAAAHHTADINDAQIASIVVTANQVDVDAGELARARASSAEVKKFAQTMVADHTSVNKSAVDLATKLGVTPQDNDTSRALKAGGDKNVANLKTLSGRAFDKAYVDHEVAYHTQVLEAIDKTLIPGARNAELKALLVKVRPAFVAHLEHAKHLQASLAKDGEDHTITMEAARFSPATLTVAAGDTVTWVNKDLMPHTVTSAAFDSGTIAAGKSWSFTFKSKAELGYACAFHPTMTARVRVQ
jgi:putative membrane protein